MFIPSEALAWYSKLVRETGDAAAAQTMGTVMEQFANKVRNPPGADCFHFPEDSNAQHDFLLFAVSAVWRKAAGLDPLRNDNHKVLMAHCYRTLYPNAPPASDAYVAELLKSYPKRIVQTTLDTVGPNSLSAAATPAGAAMTTSAAAGMTIDPATNTTAGTSAVMAIDTSASSSADAAMLDAVHNTLTGASALLASATRAAPSTTVATSSVKRHLNFDDDVDAAAPPPVTDEKRARRDESAKHSYLQ
jgi:hypothetical protein